MMGVKIMMKSRPKIVTLDMGTFSAKLVEGTDCEDGTLDVKKYGIFSSLRMKIQDGAFINKVDYAKQLKQIRKEHFSHIAHCYCCFTCLSIYTKNFILPKIKQNELLMNIELELPSFLPEPVKQFQYDFKIFDEYDTVDQKGYHINVYALPKQLVLDCQWVLQQAGFKGKAIDIMPNICEKLYRRLALIKLRDEACIAMIDAGYSMVSVTLLESGKLKLYRSIPQGIGADNENTSLKDQWTSILHDIQRIFEYYSSYVSLSGKKPDCIYIIGFGALQPVFINQLQVSLSCRVESVEKILKSDAVNIQLTSSTDLPLLFHSLGLLIREDHDR